MPPSDRIYVSHRISTNTFHLWRDAETGTIVELTAAQAQRVVLDLLEFLPHTIQPTESAGAAGTVPPSAPATSMENGTPTMQDRCASRQTSSYMHCVEECDLPAGHQPPCHFVITSWKDKPVAAAVARSAPQGDTAEDKDP